MKIRLITGPSIPFVKDSIKECAKMQEYIIKDYDSALLHIWGYCTQDKRDMNKIGKRIRDLPGGEEFLTEQVLDRRMWCARCAGFLSHGMGTCTLCNCSGREKPEKNIIILAEVATKFLQERVKDWDGEIWYCEAFSSKDTGADYRRITLNGKIVSERQRSWPDAIIEALNV